MADLGNKIEGGFTKAKDRVCSAAFATSLPVSEFFSKAHERGRVGLTDLRARIPELFGQRINHGKGGPVTLVGSHPDDTLPGYSEDSRLKNGPLTKDVEGVNVELTGSILNAFAMTGWEQFASKSGVTVWRRDSSDIKLGSFPDEVGPPRSEDKKAGKFLCVRAAGTIDAPVDDVYRLFLTNEYVYRYNNICQECLDLGWLDRATKLTWSSSKRMGPIHSRDFVTRCHYRKLRDGSVVMATMSEQLPCEEQRRSGRSASYCRMDVTIGGYLLRPSADGKQTEFNMISLANPGGVLDSPVGAKLSNWVCATGPVNFVNSIRQILQEEGEAAAASGRQLAMA